MSIAGLESLKERAYFEVKLMVHPYVREYRHHQRLHPSV